MKLSLVIGFCGLLSLQLCAQKEPTAMATAEVEAHGDDVVASTGYNIDITVENFAADEAYLAYYYGDKQYIKDTTEVVNGKAVFQADTLLEGGLYLFVMPPKNNYFEFIIDKDQEFSLKTDTLDLVGNMKIEGSLDNDIFYEDLKFLGEQKRKAGEFQAVIKEKGADSAEGKKAQDGLKSLDGEVKAYRSAFSQKYPGFLYTKILKTLEVPEVPEAPVDEHGHKDENFAFFYYRGHFLDNVDFSDERLLRTPILYNKMDQYLEKLTYKHPDSIAKSIDQVIDKTRGNDNTFQYFVVHLLNKYANSKIMGMDGVYVHMVEKYYMSGEAFWSDQETIDKMAERALALSPTLIGRLAPNFRVMDNNGKYWWLHDVQGEYTILYFWDYDCGHCKKVTPELTKAYNERIDKSKVQLFTVSINGDVEVWKEKLKEYDITGIPTQDHRRQSGFDKMYDIRSTPRLILLDKDKKVLAKQITVEQLEDLLKKFQEDKEAG